MNVRLVVVDGPTKTADLNLRKTETLVGRQKGCDVRIPSDQVSRRHCLLLYKDGRLMVEDLQSANGTFVNGARVDEPLLIRPGELLRIGPLQFRVEYTLATKALRPKAEPMSPRDLTDDELPAAAAPGDHDESDGGGIYGFKDEPKRTKRKKHATIEIPIDDHAMGNLPQGEAFRDLLRGMDH
jgi:pSer/pThr/pTyr-binding forkhead associated (FHA) protein